MSSKLYDQMWSEALQDFLDLYQEEFKPYDQVSAVYPHYGLIEYVNQTSAADAKKRSAVKKPSEWLQFYANLYISYIQLYKKVEDVYDQFVHPQKIAIVRSILDNCIMRLHEIRKDLVMFNVGTKALNSDFVNFDELLFEKKILPEKLEIPIPRYLRQDTPALRERDNMVLEYLKREDRHLPEEEVLEIRNPVETDIESDIWEILKNERGRQGIIHAQQKRAQQIANLKKKKKKDVPEVKADVEGSLIVQKYLRAFIDRKEIERMRREEEEFLGIKIPKTDMTNVPKLRKLDRGAEDLDTLVAAVRAERKGKQHTAANELEVVTHKVRKEIVDHETPDMKENLLQKMRTWITEYYEQHEGKELPDKIEDFYKKDDKAKPLTKEEEDAKKKADAEKEKAAKKAADDKKKGKMTEEEAFKEARAARGPDNSRPLRVLNEEVQKYLDEWVSRGDVTAGAARPNKELIIREAPSGLPSALGSNSECN